MIDIGKLQELVEVKAPVTRNNLSLFPLTARFARSVVSYTPFGQAAGKGEVRITEVSGAGSVPQLAVVNGSKADILLVDGEELIGAKQNRIVNLTLLIAANSTLTIPVTCVEAGRWSMNSP